jgi:hypothetical protein
MFSNLVLSLPDRPTMATNSPSPDLVDRDHLGAIERLDPD